MAKNEKKTKASKTEEKKTAKKATATKEPKEKAPSTKETKEKPENTIFVGSRPAMVYVLAVMTCFNEGKAKEVKICARGRAISTAVDVAELVRNRFITNLKVKSITTSTESVVRREGGGEANVSAIEIVLAK
ncbi:DNA-binding protein Alba [Candidatus Heimdallarchaeota archaeon]|nr:MAG: DNA-binding protein Alba [Candidatus Gerdarchaeota archaeon]RLI67877.1 MAG: DNA-binding protein Alba [Candidatus Gerdarchaeota archaeon]RLI70380.1 MAG: DNA-binding protein Alba [Candidatus Heimdallarchaeota archaeon]